MQTTELAPTQNARSERSSSRLMTRCGQNPSCCGASWLRRCPEPEVLPLPILSIVPLTRRHTEPSAFSSFHTSNHAGPERRLLLRHETFMKSQILLFFPPVRVPRTRKTNKLVTVGRHQRPRWKSGNLYRSVAARRGGAGVCSDGGDASCAHRYSQRLAFTCTLAHTLKGTSAFSPSVSFHDALASQIFK